MIVHKVGLVGAGAWGERYIETLNRMAKSSTWADHLEFTALLRQKPVRPEGLKSTTEFFTDFHGFRSSGVESVIIATNPDQEKRIKFIEKFIYNGFNVMVEKPFALSSKGLAGLYSIPIQRDASIMVNSIHLSSRAWSRAKSILSSLGKIISIESSGIGCGPIRSYDPLFDYGSHDVSMVMDLLGDVPTVHRHTVEQCRNGGKIYQTQCSVRDIPILMRYGNGSDQKERMFRVVGSNGWFEIDDIKPYDKLIFNGVVVQISSAVSPLERAIWAFLKGKNNMYNSSPDNRFDKKFNINVIKFLERLEKMA